MTEGTEITLEELLDARERRAAKQKSLIEKYRLPLISFTVNMPGPRKKTPVSRQIFREGCEVLMKLLDKNGASLACFEPCEPDTGPEAYFAVAMDERDLKAQVLQLEEAHPLGRLFDFDVIGQEGQPVSREALGHPKRKCLLCEKDAHICGRSREHSVEELLKKIQSIVDSYF